MLYFSLILLLFLAIFIYSHHSRYNVEGITPKNALFLAFLSITFISFMTGKYEWNYIVAGLLLTILAIAYMDKKQRESSKGSNSSKSFSYNILDAILDAL